MESVGLELVCKQCQKVFHICKGCYRGQVYCSSDCKITGQRENRRKAQQKYEETKKGKRGRAKRQERHRRKGRAKLDDITSSPLSPNRPSQIIDDRSPYPNQTSNKVTHTPSINKKVWIEMSQENIRPNSIQAKRCCRCGIALKKMEGVHERNRMEEDRLGWFRPG